MRANKKAFRLIGFFELPQRGLVFTATLADFVSSWALPTPPGIRQQINAFLKGAQFMRPFVGGG